MLVPAEGSERSSVTSLLWEEQLAWVMPSFGFGDAVFPLKLPDLAHQLVTILVSFLVGSVEWTCLGLPRSNLLSH